MPTEITPEYTLSETIWSLRGGMLPPDRFYPIDTAVSAAHWLERAPLAANFGEHELSFSDTLHQLNAWLKNDEPELPDALALAALYWLNRSAYEQGISCCRTCGAEGHHGCVPDTRTEDEKEAIREMERYERRNGRHTP